MNSSATYPISLSVRFATNESLSADLPSAKALPFEGIRDSAGRVMSSGAAHASSKVGQYRRLFAVFPIRAIPF